MRFLALFVLLCALGAPALADETPPQADAPPSELDKLYARLAKTPFPDEAAGILQEIDAERMKSGSDAADLLISRAEQAAKGEDMSLSLQLFDAVVDLYPDWSKGWGQRAAARFKNGDERGAMGDLGETLKREPRDLGALAGLGAILLEAGQPENALAVYDRALALAPAYEPLKEARQRAQTAVWSRTP